MKVLLINTLARGGAANATYRLTEGLRQQDVDAIMLVRDKVEPDANRVSVKTDISLHHQLQFFVASKIDAYLTRQTHIDNHIAWSSNSISTPLASIINQYKADLVHLVWVSRGFLGISDVAKIQAPILWRLPDMWTITGGCHYSHGCDGFTHQCGFCPILHSNKEYDLSRRIWENKAKHWKNLKIHFVAPSHWLAGEIQRSSLFHNQPVRVIPNGLDTQIFAPTDKLEARQKLKLPLDQKLILFGAVGGMKDKNKGSDLLIDALQQLPIKWRDKADLVIFGEKEPQNPPQINFNAHYLGHIDSLEKLALLYSVADVMLVPSRYEAFGQVASESLACGTPVVAFNATGLKDIIDHQQNGYLAQAYEPSDLAKGIQWILETDNYEQLSQHAREKAVNTFDSLQVAQQYKDTYQSILEHGHV